MHPTRLTFTFSNFIQFSRELPAYSPALGTLRIALNSDPLTGRALLPVAIANRA